jgi:PAS domain S-box-containing protein
VIGTVGGQFGFSSPTSSRPFIDYLSAEIPDYEFSVTTYSTIEAMISAVDQQALHFALITPVAYVQLNARHPVRTIATVTNPAGNTLTPWLAGMVFVRDDRPDLNSLQDVRGQDVAALSPLGLGGWLSAVREWRRLGIDEETDLASISFVFSYAQVVRQVCDGAADVGVLPGSGLQSEGVFCEHPLRVLPAPVSVIDPRYPVPISTQLYPEVPFAVVGEVPESLVIAMTMALLRIEAGSAAARAIDIGGFTAPLDYDPVADLLRELRISPFEDFGQMTFADVLSQHGGKLLSIMAVFMSFLVIAYFRTRKLNIQLAQSERFRQQIFHGSNFPVAIVDPETTCFVDLNPAAVAIYGYKDKAALIGKSPMMVSALTQYDGADTLERIDYLNHIIKARGGTPAVFDWQHKRPDGSLWDAEVHLTPFTSGDRELVQATIVDITERKRIREERERMEQQLRHSQRLESIGRLSGAIAHDFNNLLTVINGYSELLLMTTGKKDPHRETYMQITQACWRARELTYQLLTFSRRQITRMDPLDLNKIILDSVSMFRSLLGENIKLTTALNTNIGLTMADSGQIHQVLLNFVVNAKDAMPDGGHFSITTDICQLDANEAEGLGVNAGEYITVSVSDNGSGMSRETQEKIFEPFFTTKGEKGNGFGLATAYGIIRQCRGTIRFQSEVNVGTTFVLYLPVTDQDKEARGDTEPKPALHADGPRTILVVEDQPDVRMYACSVLQAAGYQVLEADSGARALGIARAHPQPIDLLFTDVVLGGMNGRELAEEFQQQFPQTPFLFTSGYADDEVALYGVIQDRIAFLSKPYSPHDLLTKVKSVLEESEQP